MADIRRGETLLNYHRRRLEELKEIRRPWEPIWQELCRLFRADPPSPLGPEGRPEVTPQIIDSTATQKLDVLKSGMHIRFDFAFSPLVPPFRSGQRSFGSARREGFTSLRFRNECANCSLVFEPCIGPFHHVGYGDLVLFGQSVAILVADV